MFEVVNDGEAIIKIFTLNCWGLKFVSKQRKERFKAITEYLSQRGSGYDVVFLQEVWVHEDYETLKNKLCSSHDLYPYAHYFDNGIIGSGTCILSKVQLLRVSYHEFSMNGYPTTFWHGDWFGSKGIGVCQIRFDAKNHELKGVNPDFFDVHLYTSHYHANYDAMNDVYLGHRVIQAFESAQWIKLTSSTADLTIYAGDFNTEPHSLPYRILRNVAPLEDAWEYYCEHLAINHVGKTRNGGYTSEAPNNSFTNLLPTTHNIEQDSLPDTNICVEGKRIDYIMYNVGPNAIVTPLSCNLPLPNRIPGENFSFSDHEAVDAMFKVTRRIIQDDDKHCGDPEQQHNTECSGANFKRAQCNKTRNDCVKSVQEAIEVMNHCLVSITRGQTKYAIFTVLSVLFFLISFLPSGIQSLTAIERISLDLGLFFPRMVLATATVIFSLMGTLFSKRERNAIREVKKQLNLILDQDV